MSSNNKPASGCRPFPFKPILALGHTILNTSHDIFKKKKKETTKTKNTEND